MRKRVLQLSALAVLSALLVFAPEIFTAVSAPYRVAPRERVLLRVALCTRDEDAASAFYAALEEFRKRSEGVHLRVERVDETSLASLPDPPPDVYVIPPEAGVPQERLFLPLDVGTEGEEAGTIRYAYACALGAGEPLLCAVSARTARRDAALALVGLLRGEDGE